MTDLVDSTVVPQDPAAQGGGESPPPGDPPVAGGSPEGEIPQEPAAPPMSIEERIRAELAKGGSSLDVLTALKGLIDSETARLKAEEREKSEAARRQRRAELVGRINEMVDLGSLLNPFLAEAKEAGLLGLAISFAGDTLTITPQSNAPAVPRASSTERKTAPDGQTPVRSAAGQSAEPGDEATWLAVTPEADRQFDLEAIEREVAEAEGRGRTGKSVRNSITWRVRHDRIKLARGGPAVGHLKPAGTA